MSCLEPRRDMVMSRCMNFHLTYFGYVAKAINCDIKYNPDKGCRSKTSFAAAHKNDAGIHINVLPAVRKWFHNEAACRALKGLRLFLLREKAYHHHLVPDDNGYI